MKPSDTTLLLTRPAPAATRFAAELEAETGAFALTVVSPVLDIVPRGAVPDLPDGAALAFTSENAVALAATQRDPGGRRAWCVGARTAEAARAAGYDAVTAGGDAGALAALLFAQPPAGEIVHLSGAHQRGDLAERLSEAGLPARRVVIYDQVPRPLSPAAGKALKGPRPVLVPLFSPRSAALVSSGAAAARAPLLVAALSPAVAEAWKGPAPRGVAIAERPEAGALIAAIARLLAATPGA